MISIQLATGLAALAVSASLFTGCAGNSTQNAVASQTKAQSAAAVESTASQAQSTVSTPAATESATTATESVAQANTASAVDQTAVSSTQISVDDAKKAALTHAGLSESDIVYKKAALDNDDGIIKYDVDFYGADTEYEYDIDATTGAVLKSEASVMDAEDYAERDALTGTVSAAADKAAATAQGITEDQALEIALKHAGLTKNDISALQIHQDFDDDMGVTKYEIDFHVGAKEYNYDIDTTTGQIYESEVDIDD